jgi:hypothetical protein
LLDKAPQEPEVQLCAMSIRAQCFGPLLYARRRKSAQDLPTTGIEPLLDDVEKLADHVSRFSLAGIRALRPRHPRQSNNDELVTTALRQAQDERILS